MVVETGKSATSTAEEMGIDTNTVCKWGPRLQNKTRASKLCRRERSCHKVSKRYVRVEADDQELEVKKKRIRSLRSRKKDPTIIVG